MLIKDLLAQSDDYKDLQALIMFLVFEKGVVSLDDPTEELDLYFKEQHNTRMNKELHAYKAKMNMKYDPQVFEVSGGNLTTYIYAKDEDQAALLASRNSLPHESIKTCDMDEYYTFKGNQIKLRDLVKVSSTPKILGGF